MASDVTYIPPSQAEWTRIATNPTLRASLLALGAKAQAIAEGLSADFSNTGHYASSFGLHVSIEDIFGHPRSVVSLVNTASYAAEVEIRHHVLTRTADLLSAT